MGDRLAGSDAIRRAETADIAALLRLEEEVFAGDRLARRAFRHAVASPTIVALVVPGPESVRAYVLVEFRRGSRVGRLTSLAVHPAAAGRGLGRALLGRAEEETRAAGRDRVRLEVRADNARAAALYERGGYRLIGTVPDYYEDGCAARRYEKALAG